MEISKVSFKKLTESVRLGKNFLPYKVEYDLMAGSL